MFHLSIQDNIAMASMASVLRIGPTNDNASAVLLRTALLSHFETEGEPNVLTVSNRYFAARIRLEEIVTDQTTTNDVPQKEDGIILVFDALRSNPDIIGGIFANSFDALTLVHSHAEQAKQCGELVRLCVGVSLGPKNPSDLRGEKYEDEYSRRVLWCLDRGYEYVEADLSEQGQRTGHNERDKDGFARIVEAISGTVWSSAVMGASKQETLKQSYGKDKEALQDTEESNPYIPPDPSLPASDTIQESSATPDTSNKIQSSLIGDSKLDLEEGFVDGGNASEQERVMESLEGILREASRIRETSRNGELSDDERRKRASDAASLMMDLMSQLDTEDDSGVDSSDEGD
jgi:Alpha and gamma adaptin binding protein p34